MADFLNAMAESSAARLTAARQRHDDAQILQFAEVAALPKSLSLHRNFSVIAEIKANSPAEGALASSTLDRGALATTYSTHGASAVSVLTEPERFAGDLEHLAEVATVLGDASIPAMRKDFLVDPYQVAEARIAGAGGVLLIVAMLENAILERMVAIAEHLSLFVLIECFDADDLERAERLLDGETALKHLQAGQIMLGINTRDLRTLEVDTERLARLAPRLPRDVPVIAESGLKVPDEAARVAELGYRGALIGSALMRSDAPGALLRAFVDRGRGR
ncbi:MAG: indole-3-glycerol-phosphate synthase [Pseudomonadota bacterium]